MMKPIPIFAGVLLVASIPFAVAQTAGKLTNKGGAPTARGPGGKPMIQFRASMLDRRPTESFKDYDSAKGRFRPKPVPVMALWRLDSHSENSPFTRQPGASEKAKEKKAEAKAVSNSERRRSKERLERFLDDAVSSVIEVGGVISLSYQEEPLSIGDTIDIGETAYRVKAMVRTSLGKIAITLHDRGLPDDDQNGDYDIEIAP